WYVISLFGTDQLGIVAKTTQCLYQLDANLSETSMNRLGDYFTMMMFVQYSGDIKKLRSRFQGIADDMNLQFHLDKIEQHIHSQLTPNIRICCYSSDRSGLVAQVSAELLRQQVNIVNVQTDVSNQDSNSLFIMTIEGIMPVTTNTEGAKNTASEHLTDSIATLKQQGIDIHVETIETLVG
ncbi:MAG: glycine cleavage system protein R, partial [Thiohalomonadales bacterium]